MTQTGRRVVSQCLVGNVNCRTIRCRTPCEDPRCRWPYDIPNSYDDSALFKDATNQHSSGTPSDSGRDPLKRPLLA
jgi:hypothetical protein